MVEGWRNFYPSWLVGILCLIMGTVCSNPAAAQDARPAISRSTMGRIRTTDFTVLPSFSSHLPIIVIEPDTGASFGSSMSARVSIYHNGASDNTLRDTPVATLVASMRRDTARGGGGTSPAAEDGKFSYWIENADTDPVSLAGLPLDRQWLLHGSIQDKSMLRNGLAYELGRSIFPDIAPETRYCEVLVRQGTGYRYEGIYILVGCADPTMRTVTAGSPQTVFLKRTIGQERRGDHIVRAGTKVFSVFRSNGCDLDPWPMSQEERRRVAIDLEKLESVLTAVTPASFLEYHDFIEEKSAINFFILNTLTLNALSGPAPLLLAKDGDGMLSFLPVWDFDTSFDNMRERNFPLPFEKGVPELSVPSVLSRRVPVWRTLEAGGSIEDLRMYPVYQEFAGDNFLWLDRLFLSRSFLTGLYERYHELRRGPLSPARLAEMADRQAGQLGQALETDWARWQEVYTAETGPHALEPYIDAEMEEHNRQTWSVDQELVKINHSLREQDRFIIGQLEELDWMTGDLYAASTSGTRQAAYAFITLFAMFFLTHLLTRRL